MYATLYSTLTIVSLPVFRLWLSHSSGKSILPNHRLQMFQAELLYCRVRLAAARNAQEAVSRYLSGAQIPDCRSGFKQNIILNHIPINLIPQAGLLWSADVSLGIDAGHVLHEKIENPFGDRHFVEAAVYKPAGSRLCRQCPTNRYREPLRHSP